MRRRWIADEYEQDRAALTGSNAAHLARVLRARVGQKFDIALPGETAVVRRGTITSAGENRVEFELGELVEADAPQRVDVYLAIFKFDRFEWAVEKLTELGTARLIPVIAQRTEKHLAAAAEKRAERWRRIAREAAQQSRRAVPLEIAVPMKLKSAVADPEGTKMLLAESEGTLGLQQALENAYSPVSLAVGPEGGWTDQEIRLFSEFGWEPASLGSTILRAETAAIAAAAITVSTLSFSRNK